MRSFKTASIFRPKAWAATAMLTLGLVLGGCGSGSEEEPDITRGDFCEQWADAACSSEVVSVCQASSADDCRAAQSAACLDQLPDDFIDRGVASCISAVRRAYDDADLTAAELDIVLRFRGPCSDIILASESGETCGIDADCESALSCVFKDETNGTCEDPVIIEPGFSCSEPEEACEAGFYCDGRNCIAALTEGDECSNDSQCGSDMYCDDVCTEKLGINEACVSDASCDSGICYEVGAEQTCLDRLRLSPSEPLCADLK